MAVDFKVKDVMHNISQERREKREERREKREVSFFTSHFSLVKFSFVVLVVDMSIYKISLQSFIMLSYST